MLSKKSFIFQQIGILKLSFSQSGRLYTRNRDARTAGPSMVQFLVRKSSTIGYTTKISVRIRTVDDFGLVTTSMVRIALIYTFLQSVATRCSGVSSVFRASIKSSNSIFWLQIWFREYLWRFWNQSRTYRTYNTGKPEITICFWQPNSFSQSNRSFTFCWTCSTISRCIWRIWSRIYLN